MHLNSLSPAPGAKTTKKRVGRGIGSGKGKTCGRGPVSIAQVGPVLVIRLARERSLSIEEDRRREGVEIAHIGEQVERLGGRPEDRQRRPAVRDRIERLVGRPEDAEREPIVVAELVIDLGGVTFVVGGAVAL